MRSAWPSAGGPWPDGRVGRYASAVTRGLPELLSTLTTAVPPWVLAVAVVALLPLVVPAWLRYVRGKQIRGRLRTAFRETREARRAALIDEAFSLAGERPLLVVVLADAALAMGMRLVVQRAVERLDALGGPVADRRRLRRELKGEARAAGHPVEEVVVVERMLDEGLLVAARARLDEALARFPADAELIALRDRLRAAEGAVGS